MKPLVIGDKEYQAVQYKDGGIWIERRPAKDGEICLAPYGNGLFTFSSKDPGDGVENVVIAHTDVGLDGVPCVKPYKTPRECLMDTAVMEGWETGQDFINAQAEEVLDIFSAAIKMYAAQSKGCYTEEQMRKAIDFGWDSEGMTKNELSKKYGFKANGHHCDNVEKFLQSIQPKLVVLMEGDQPATYQKDGKTYYKLIN